MLSTRPMTHQDVPACAAILNATIKRGGTTAHTDPFSEAEFSAEYFEEPSTAQVVEHLGRVVGFQCAFDKGDGVLSVGSFTDQETPVKGAGRALFPATCAEARAKGFTRIIAKITADNAPGLAYYAAMGLHDIDVIPNDILRNGRPVDRVVKALDL